MSIKKLDYGKKLNLSGVKLKIDFLDEPFMNRLTAEANRSFREILGYGTCDIYDRNRKKILTILERKQRRSMVQSCN